MIPSSLTIMLHMDRMTAASVPGIMGTHSDEDDVPAEVLHLGSKTTIFIPRFLASDATLAENMAEWPEPCPLLEPKKIE
jgi:hypothetical protein